MRVPRHLAAAAILCLLAAALPADEAEDAFNQLYGDDVRRVAATPSPADDVALAKQLVDAAAKTAGQPAFTAVLCQKAYDLGAKDASGHATAVEAMDLLAAAVPARGPECLQKSAALYQRAYATARGDARTAAGEALIETLCKAVEAQAAAGDADAAAATLRQALTVAAAIKSEAKAALQARLDGILARQKVERQLAALRARLEKDPADAAARKELVRTYLVEKDDPAEAAKYLDESLDETTRKYVPGAAKPLEDAPERACKELGDWYRGLADDAAAPAAKAAMLRRAQGYYARFLDLHPASDLARTAATLALARVEDALAKLGPAAAGPDTAGGWVDCLKMVDAAKHTIEGHWERKGGHVVLAPTGRVASLTIPAAPSGNYDLEATFVRTAGLDVGFFFPVGARQAHLDLCGSGGEWSGLEPIDGKGGSDNSTTVRPGTLVNGHEYTVDIKVRVAGQAATIEVGLDGKPYTRWQGPLTSLAERIPKSPDPACLGLNAWETTGAEFRRLRVRMLSGELKTPEAPPKLTAAWTDCLKLVDLEKNVVSGSWERQGAAVGTKEPGDAARVMVPVSPSASYELEARVVRVSGSEHVVLILPFKSTQVECALGTNVGGAMLFSIGGRTVDTPCVLVNGREYEVRATVMLADGKASLTVSLDGKRLLEWEGPESQVSLNPGWRLPAKDCIGLGGQHSMVLFKGVRVRAIPGEAAKPGPRRPKG